MRRTAPKLHQLALQSGNLLVTASPAIINGGSSSDVHRDHHRYLAEAQEAHWIPAEGLSNACWDRRELCQE